MGLFSGFRGNFRFWLKGYLFLGVALLVVVVLLYSNRVINRMQDQSEATTRLFSHFIAEVVLQVREPGKREVLQEVLREIRLPVILTDVEGRPIAWHRVGVPEPRDEDFEKLLRIDPKNPPPGKISQLIELVKKLDGLNDPIPISVGAEGGVQGYVHFGNSELQRELRLMAFIQLAIFLIFMAVGFQGFRYLKLSEQRSIWVGMAKETAHQLGTPLSALLGWVQLLKDRCAGDEAGRQISSTLGEMGEDLNRLSKVTARFSKIGSHPELRDVRIDPILERTVQYFHKRLPRLRVDSAIKIDLGETPSVRGNEELLEWVFENLLKNGIDALGEGGGSIEIATSFNEARRCVEVFVRDTGRGIPPPLKQRVFSPGFTTKKRGWGLGLALTRRIVEDYHGGELKLLESRPGKGTVFLVRIPATPG